jgi:hypothetical protein
VRSSFARQGVTRTLGAGLVALMQQTLMLMHGKPDE